MISGIFFIASGVSFPAVLVRDLGGGSLLICVFTENGPEIRTATDDTTEHPGVFSRD